MDRARLHSTGLPARAVSSTRTVEFVDGWTLSSSAPGAWTTPADLPHDRTWQPAVVPGTVALSVGARDLDSHDDYDASDWWYRCSLPAPVARESGSARVRLRLDGLATLAEVWFNGQRVLHSSNMFRAYEVDVTDLVEPENELAISFRSLNAALSERRPRPRWKTKLVPEQQLRWFRTTLLGRIPGWTPAIHPVGPWRSVWLETISVLDVESLDVRASVAGTDGRVELTAVVQAIGPKVRVESASLRIAERDLPVDVSPAGGAWMVRGTVGVPQPALWWPATHGEPALHPCSLHLRTSAGPVDVSCDPVGFRDLRLDRADGRIQFVINGVPVFCRGSCWTTNDIVSLVGDQSRMRRVLQLLADEHGNMVRVGGTMVYETDDFYRACDELGLMVWQDFMFANMDYPVDDPSFASEVRREADQQLRRLSRHPSVVAFCGGSEVEQQAAMFGAPRGVWSNRFTAEVLPALVGEHAPGVPYWPSTPTEGVLPFHVGEGLAHYYGVGAYRRPLEDVRLARVKFSPECLGFSHVPEPDNLRGLTVGGAVPPHDPSWKRGVPRDTGPGWDFEDIRDHYLEQIYGVHAVRLRSEDLDRYLALSRVVTGEVMAHVFAEWRNETDPCGGALTWFLNDLRAGAGWGLIDSDGWPKPVYYHLRRAWAPQCVRFLDRGLDGLLAMVLNEAGRSLDATLELVAIGRGAAPVAETIKPIRVAARSSTQVPVEEAFGHFVDSTYSYRFGPPRHQAIVARLVSEDGQRVISEDVYRPVPSSLPATAELLAEVQTGSTGELLVTLSTEAILLGVRIDVRDHRPVDNHFCLTPGRPRTVALHRVAESGRAFQGHVEALNLPDSVRLVGPA